MIIKKTDNVVGIGSAYTNDILVSTMSYVTSNISPFSEDATANTTEILMVFGDNEINIT